jgi:hypothetical protein
VSVLVILEKRKLGLITRNNRRLTKYETVDQATGLDGVGSSLLIRLQGKQSRN